MIIKNNLPIPFVENIWLKWLTLDLCPKLNFPSKKHFHARNSTIVKGENKILHVFITLEECHFSTISFDLWMSEGAYDVFALVINFLGDELVAKTCDY